MASMSNYLENKLVDFLFRGVTYAPPATLYVALLTAAASDSSTGSTVTEVTGGNYARQPLTSNATNWFTTNADNAATSSGTGGTTGNSVAILWSSVTWSATVTDVAICDALTGGNVLFYSTLASSKTLAPTDSLSFAINSLTIQIDN